jgi:hypothetical protein
MNGARLGDSVLRLYRDDQAVVVITPSAGD